MVERAGCFPGFTTAEVVAGADRRFVVSAGWRPEHFKVGVCLQDPAEQYPGCGRDDDGLQKIRRVGVQVAR